MQINYLKVSEKLSYLLNLTAFSPKFSLSPPGKRERNTTVKTRLTEQGCAGWDVSCSCVFRCFTSVGSEGLCHGKPR